MATYKKEMSKGLGSDVEGFIPNLKRRINNLITYYENTGEGEDENTGLKIGEEEKIGKNNEKIH